MSTNTPNYKLKKPDPSDFYNIADFNGNADIIDTQLKSINDRYTDLSGAVETNTVKVDAALAMGVRTLSCTKSGNTFKLTQPLPSTGMYSCIFTAPADYTTGDSFTVNGTIYAVSTSDGEELSDKAFVSGAVVPVVLDQAGKTINFKQAGRKLTLSAESYLMVKCFTANGTFTAPMTGKYRVTCIGKGGDGGDSNSKSSVYQLNGAGGGAGGAARRTFNLKKGGEAIPITANSTASFGSYLSAGPGENAGFYEGSGSTSNYYVIPGQPGSSSGGINFQGNVGKPGTNINYRSLQDGGDGGAFQPAQSPFLAVSGGIGGHYSHDALGNPQLPVIRSDGASPDKPTPSGLAPFGAGGGGAIYGANCKGGSGGQAAVIIELILD